MDRYPNISDHGLIGDLQTAALVTTDGVLDWFCCPRFDSPSVFASPLDAGRGGFYRIAPDRDDYVTRQLYLPEHGAVFTADGLESMGGPPRRITPAEARQLEDDTARFWRNWLSRSAYTGRWREMVGRSAITLKLMTYAPTGALVAAPTAGLPEQVGGERNWDYRYTWIRDGSFSIYALLGLGYVEEAAAFGEWLRHRVQEQAGGGSGPLKIMYRVDGTSDLTEETLDHFEGWRGSRPVRIGNGAADQLQLDIYGEAADAIYLADSHGVQMAHQGWQATSRIIDWLCEHWDQPDEGIWETRGGRKDFTYGRFQTWVALDRAIRLAQQRGRPADIARWTTERDAVYRQVMERGWNPTAWPATKAPSPCARSGTPMPWPGPDGSTRPGWPSRRCTPMPTTSGCTPRRSAAPVSSSGTSRRPSATCRSSAPRSTSTVSSTTPCGPAARNEPGTLAGGMT